ncbi:MAG: GDP-mannose 4,6-dehydratase, partial [Planctomycetes bacterium]|nr:GDP-mannose 4,6-dehydratase [Planctomycetota bacterium]
EHPQRESYWGHVNPIGERACYDEGKRFAEALIVNYRRQFPIRARVARIFNTYGPRMRSDDGRVLPNFITQAMAGRPLTVHGAGAQTRSFCFVTDLVDGLIRLAASEVEGPVNLGNPQEITIREFAEEIIRLTESRSEIASVERPKDDPNVRCPDITRATTLLGWTPKVERREGLAKTVAWFQQHLRSSGGGRLIV